MLNHLLYHFFVIFNEVKTHAFLNEFLYFFPTSTLLDAGAYLGDTSIPLAAQHTQSKIIAIEPSLQNCKFIEQKNKSNNLLLYNCALSDSNEKCLTTEYDWFKSNKIYKESTKGIPTKTIDSFYRLHPALTLIHLDVETYEYRCLQGCKQILHEKKPLFIIELLDKNADKMKIQLFFKRHQYREYYIPESVSFHLETGYNHVFVPPTNVYAFFIEVCLSKGFILKTQGMEK